MSHTNEHDQPTRQPALADLFREYIQRQVLAHSTGLALADAEGEVIPHEAATTPAVDPHVAWEEATAATSHFVPGAAKVSGTVPPGWPGLVSSHEPAAAVSLSFGNFPQLVRDVKSLLDAGSMSCLRSMPAQPFQVPDLERWALNSAAGDYPLPLLATGVLRLARQFDRAADLLKECAKTIPDRWQAARQNEEAALAWDRGCAEQAAQLWKSQEPSASTNFNRGMAALFLDRPAEARKSLSAAVASLPEDSGWHHLARLYLALAEMRK
jgi:tetratricopeptide (TPR) repeat protein